MNQMPQKMEKENTCRTDFLFSTPSFLTGAGSIFNIRGNYFRFNTSSSPELADMRAIQSDWCMVGRDLRGAYEEYRKQLVHENETFEEVE